MYRLSHCLSIRDGCDSMLPDVLARFIAFELGSRQCCLQQFVFGCAAHPEQGVGCKVIDAGCYNATTNPAPSQIGATVGLAVAIRTFKEQSVRVFEWTPGGTVVHQLSRPKFNHVWRL